VSLRDKILKSKPNTKEESTKLAATFFEGYSDVDPAQTVIERETDPPATRSRLKATLLDARQDELGHPAQPLWFGERTQEAWTPSTHRGSTVDHKAINQKREEQEARAGGRRLRLPAQFV